MSEISGKSRKTIRVRNVTLKTGKTEGSKVINAELLSEFRTLFNNMRGEILDESIAIQTEMERCLKLLGELPPASEPGQGFMNTRDKLSDSLKGNQKLKSSTKQLRHEAHHVITIRNKYAHGKLRFNNDVPVIVYKKRGQDGKERTATEPISEDYLKGDLRFITKVLDDMRSLYTMIKKVRTSLDT